MLWKKIQEVYERTSKLEEIRLRLEEGSMDLINLNTEDVDLRIMTPHHWWMVAAKFWQKDGGYRRAPEVYDANNVIYCVMPFRIKMKKVKEHVMLPP
jgi:hypothetical protein